MKTDGQNLTCEGCRFWSEMIAQSLGGGPLEAMCLADEGPHRRRYTTGRMSCGSWKSGHLGAIVDPDVGEGLVEAYAAEDAMEAT